MTTPVSRSPQADEFYEHDPRISGGGFDRPRSFSLAQAVRRHWFLTILPVIVLAAAGIAVGYAKPRTYTAQATINVGKSDIATQATPGYLTAAEALASSYSRLVTSNNIAVPAGRAVGESPGTALGQLSAVPIPQEPTFTISATGSSSAQATKLANAAVTALTKYASTSATQQGGPQQLLSRYQAAQHQAFILQRKAGNLQGKLNAGSSATGPSVSQAQVANAKVAAQTAQLKAQSLSQQYLNLSQGVAPSLDVLVSPTGATSTNRTTNMEKYGVIGAVAGLVIGIAFAGLTEGVGVAADRRRHRRVAY